MIKIDGFAVGGRSGFSPVYQDVWLAKYQQGTEHLSSEMNAVAGILDEPFSQLTPLSGVAVQARHTLRRLEPCRAGRYGYSAERAELSKVRLKLPLQYNSVGSMVIYGILKPKS